VSDETLLGPPKVQRRLAELSSAGLNFNPAELRHADPTDGWVITDICQPLAEEPPGMPLERGSWRIATRLMRGYEFADPSIVRAYYDPDLPLQGRTMLLKLQALGLLHLFVGVRVGDVYEQTRSFDGYEARVWGWNYRTLEGHVEVGQMDWEVWKWLDSGRVEFRVHSISRTAQIANPFIRLGFHLLRGRERHAFLNSTLRRMRTFVDLELHGVASAETIREAAAQLTARRSAEHDPVYRELARTVVRDQDESRVGQGGQS
jgi:uncharacterized protein (UPF0548 family)